jgi:hypothetical protein
VVRRVCQPCHETESEGIVRFKNEMKKNANVTPELEVYMEKSVWDSVKLPEDTKHVDLDQTIIEPSFHGPAVEIRRLRHKDSSDRRALK